MGGDFITAETRREDFITAEAQRRRVTEKSAEMDHPDTLVLSNRGGNYAQ